jgi:hypothetical protein
VIGFLFSYEQYIMPLQEEALMSINAIKANRKSRAISYGCTYGALWVGERTCKQ